MQSWRKIHKTQITVNHLKIWLHGHLSLLPVHRETLITRVFSADSVTAHYHLMQQLYDTLHLVKINTKIIAWEEQLIECVCVCVCVWAMKWPPNY
jgi:hypothetical protein